MSDLVPFFEDWEPEALPEGVRDPVLERIVTPLVTSLHADKFDLKVTSDFRHAIAIQTRREAETWSFANPAFHRGMGRHNSFVLIVETDGEPVACLGARLVWIEGSLSEAIRSKGLLYDDPRRQASPGEEWVISSRILDGIRNTRVCWIVSACKVKHADAHLEPGRPPLFGRLARLLNVSVLARWHWSDLVGFAGEWVSHERAIQDEGFKALEMGVYHVPGFGEPKRKYHVLHSTRDYTRDLFTNPRVTDALTGLDDLHAETTGRGYDEIADRFARVAA